ncbi:MAG: hypothetical protein PHQ75_12980, partial [Thermoguttaceae bacterium]|nr:hypothetical protein [Thermoguttaceae bacterium]
NVRQTFPDYIQRKTTIEAVNAVHCVPEGTSLVFEFECDTPLGTIALRPESAAKVQRLAGQEKRFTIMSQALHRVLRFDLYLEDQNGIAPREPLGVHIEIVPDRAPTVKATTPGTGRRITPFARIPYTVSVADDYGINSLFLDMRKGNGSSWGSWESMRLTTLWPPAMEYETQGVFDAALLPLKPGDMLSLRPTATDYKPIQDGRGERFQTGTGPVRDFEIVDPAQLKESLEVEEYGYRDRLVNLIRQTQQTKDLMSGTMGVSKDQAIPWSRVLRDLQKEMFDATQIALGITGLCEEIRNNRLCQSPEHSLDSIALSRIQKAGQSLYLPGHLEELQSQVVVPLESLVEKEFVLLCKRVTSASTGTDTLKPAGQKEIIGSTEKIILELNNVLAHMRSLQSFRELVDEFRVIRNDLEHSRRTTDQRKDALFHELEK